MIGMVITNNILGMNAQRQFNIVGNKKKKSTEKLSSGFRINRAADDAAGLTISEKMRSQIRGLTQGVYNTQDGVSLCQVADGALEEVDDMLHRLTELAVKASNGTNTDQDREAINQETEQILNEIDRISESTSFNDRKIFSGIDSYTLPITVGTVDIEGIYNKDAGNYRITANQTGISVGGISYSWDKFKDTNGVSLTPSQIKAGTYTADIEGLKLSFEAQENASLDDVIGRLNGVKFNTNAAPTTDLVELVGIEGHIVFAKAWEGNAAYLHCSYTPPSYITQLDMHIEKKMNAVGPGNVHEWWQWRDDVVKGKVGNISINLYNPSASNPYTLDGAITMEINVKREITLHELYETLEHATFVLGDHYSKNYGMYGTYEIYTVEGINLNSPQIPLFEGSTIGDVTQTRYKGQVHYNTNDEKAEMPLNIWIQSGCKAGDGINLEFDAMNTSILGIDNIDLSTIEGARSAISDIESALDKNNANRSKIGAQQNRLEHTIDNENNIVENTTAAESRIRDTDMAKESANLAVQNILTQAGVAMMAQANQNAQGVMQLFR